MYVTVENMRALGFKEPTDAQILAALKEAEQLLAPEPGAPEWIKAFIVKRAIEILGAK